MSRTSVLLNRSVGKAGHFHDSRIGMLQVKFSKPGTSPLGCAVSPLDRCLNFLAIANSWRLVSFERDFDRFEGLERLALR